MEDRARTVLTLVSIVVFSLLFIQTFGPHGFVSQASVLAMVLTAVWVYLRWFKNDPALAAHAGGAAAGVWAGYAAAYYLQLVASRQLAADAGVVVGALVFFLANPVTRAWLLKRPRAARLPAARGDADALRRIISGAPQEARRQGRPLSEVWAEVEGLVGLAPVKQRLREIAALVEANRVRTEQGLPPLVQSLHMCFLGNPGTGKTTVARLVGELLVALGVLPGGQVVEVARDDLVGEYIGHSEARTKEAVRRAMGGVLFIDEAYALAGGHERDFGHRVIDQLVKVMEDHRADMVVILAGYTSEMQRLFAANSGLRSRIAFEIEFPDYSPEELLEIARLEAKKQGFSLAPEAEAALLGIMRRNHGRIGALGNGRYARKLVEAAVRRAAVRIAQGGDPTTLLAEDVVEVA